VRWVVLAVFLSSSMAQAQVHWYLVGVANNGRDSTWIDPASITFNDGRTQAWEKSVTYDPAKPLHGAKFFTIRHYDFRVTRREYRLLSSEGHSVDGHIVASNNDPQRWHKIISGSVAEGLMYEALRFGQNYRQKPRN